MHPILLIVVLVICVIIVFILADIQSRKIPTTFLDERTNEEEAVYEEDEDEALEEDQDKDGVRETLEEEKEEGQDKAVDKVKEVFSGELEECEIIKESD